MDRNSRTGLSRFVGIIVVVASSLIPAVPSSGAAWGYCAAPASGLTTFTFTGAVSTSWKNAANWTMSPPGVAHYPGPGDGATGYVCIPAGKSVTLLGTGNLSGWVHVQMIDVAGALTVGEGGRIYVHGDPATRVSYLRSGTNTKLVNGSVLGGEGRYELEGTITVTSPKDFASAFTTRNCAIYSIPHPSGQDCVSLNESFPPQAGELLVADTGKVILNHPINVFDQYRITVRGLVKVQGASSLGTPTLIAADPGTSFELLPRLTTGRGTFQIANDGGYYVGRLGRSIDPTTLSVFINGGLVQKTAGPGTAVIDAAYSRVGSGSVTVQSGTLSLPTSATAPVTVGSADGCGFGTCADGALPPCMPVVSGQEAQTGQLTIPAGDTNGSTGVVLSLDGAGASGQLGQAVLAMAPGLSPLPADPATLTIRFDSTIAGGKTASTVSVQRQDTNPGPFLPIPDCVAGALPTGITSCLDRAASATASSAAGGDLVVVVRTTHFSRWVAL